MLAMGKEGPRECSVGPLVFLNIGKVNLQLGLDWVGVGLMGESSKRKWGICCGPKDLMLQHE